MRWICAGLTLCATSGCGPTVPPGETDAASADTTAASAPATSAAQASGPLTTTTDGGGPVDSSEGTPPQKFDVEGPEPEPEPCGPLEDLEPHDCYVQGVEYPTSDLQWALQSGDGLSCALVCIYSHCVTDVCLDVLDEIRVVHDGPRLIVATPNVDLFDTVDRNDEPVVQAEGWDDAIRVHVAHPVDTDSFSVWATDETTQDIVWGPIEMQRYQP